MVEEMVAVPKRLLEQLEKDRETLYRIVDPKNIHDIMMMTNATGIMWQIANTKWETVETNDE